MRRTFFFIVAIVFATTSYASIPRASMPDRASEDASAFDSPLPETRIRVSDVLAPFDRPTPSLLSRALRQGYEQASTTNASGLGRFLSVDPVIDMKVAMRYPQAWNRYAYVRNNPLRWTDPTGRIIAYDQSFRDRLKNDTEFKAAFDAWKKTKAGAAQWGAMAKDANTVYRFKVGEVKVLTGVLKEERANGMTLPVISHRNENKAGKLDMPSVSMTINADYIHETHKLVPEMTSRTMSKALFEEAQHGLDIGSGTMSAKQAWDAERRFHTDTEPRMKIFENQLNAILPPPNFD